MPRQLFVSLLPSLLDASRLAGGSVVVIDVLRASTTVCAALHAGASRVVPFANVDDARRFAERLSEASGGRQPSDKPLLGGERHGIKIDGFDLGNSPLEYTREKVAGRTVVFTTTNGTRALLAAGMADRIYMGAFANLNPLCDQLAKDPGNIHLLCAGTDGQITLEDAYVAGEIALTLSQKLPTLAFGNDEAAIAMGMAQPSAPECVPCDARLFALRSGLGGRNLIDLGYDADIEFCAKIGSAPVVPVFREGALVLEAPLVQAVADDTAWAI
jgi:2-phosphosulfolactate phosphatase